MRALWPPDEAPGSNPRLRAIFPSNPPVDFDYSVDEWNRKFALGGDSDFWQRF
jgi:hypothetical protein